MQTSSIHRIGRALSFRNISAIYIFIAIFVLFSLWVPETFLSGDMGKALLASQAVTAVLAVGLVLALAAGAFDLAIGTELGLGSIFVAWLIGEHGLPIVPAIVLTLLVGVVIGAINGLLVVKVKIDSFIATLGMSSVLLALIAWISSSQQILGLSKGFQSIGVTKVFGIALPFYIMIGIAAVLWYVLDCTATGRKIYATGGNIDAARLAGVPVSKVVVGSLVACGSIAALAGVLVSANLGTGDPTIGPGYLLPAFSAAFLGSTQFRSGRFNILGTVFAVYLLATGVKGLQLAGAPVWVPELFNGLALLIAVGMARFETSTERRAAVRRLLRRRDRSPVEPEREPATVAAAEK
ncbi:MAG: ABC transporter permease [Actinobacteria bacterium]|nr:ABC transporter permease [Actinomycetota bacterium]